MRFSPEYPNHCDIHHNHGEHHFDDHHCRPEIHCDPQSDWAEINRYSPNFIKNKPNVATSINGIVPDQKGDVKIDAEAVGVGPIPNDEIYKIVREVFEV